MGWLLARLDGPTRFELKNRVEILDYLPGCMMTRLTKTVGATFNQCIASHSKVPASIDDEWIEVAYWPFFEKKARNRWLKSVGVDAKDKDREPIDECMLAAGIGELGGMPIGEAFTTCVLLVMGNRE